MNGKYIYILFALFAALLILGCESTTETENGDYSLYGTVVDSQNDPIEGAEIHYGFTFLSKQIEKATEGNSSNIFHFQIAKKSKVEVNLLRWYTRELLEVIVDDTLNAGNYMVTRTYDKMTNGFYIYQLIIDGEVQETVFLNEVFSEEQIMSADPLAVTDSDGKFSMPYEMFGFDIDVARTSIEGDTLAVQRISQNINVIVVAPNQSPSYHEIGIDLSRDMNKTFIVE